MTPLPCPFCGESRIQVVEGSTFRWCVVECFECGARGAEVRAAIAGAEDDTETRAIEEWNRRAAQSDGSYDRSLGSGKPGGTIAGLS